MSISTWLQTLPSAWSRLRCEVVVPRSARGARRSGPRTIPADGRLLPPRSIVCSCLALLVTTATLAALGTLTTCLALGSLIDLLGQALGQEVAAEPAWSLARMLQGSGTCGGLCGLMLCARFLGDLCRQGWLRSSGSPR